jgi:hypothetical protein
MAAIQLTELNIYPVKSLRQIALSSSYVERYGLQHDRRWMVVDNDGKMITQRQIAMMCLIQPSLHKTGIQLSAQDIPDLLVNIPSAGEVQTVTVWNDTCQAYDAGEEVASWLSKFLSTSCRLVYFPEDGFRQIDLQYAQQGERTAFSDGFPLLLISQPSLDDLNQRLATPVPMKRFRPNLVIKGCQAFEEDNWKKIRIGNIYFRIVKPCSRCIIPNIDIETAEIGKEPARTLSSFRRKNNKIYFGQNVIAENEGELTIGMPVEIIE